jgi:plastocyanin domain-containing protein
MLRFTLIGMMALGLAGCSGATKQAPTDPNQVTLTVTDKGFEPAVVTVEAGKPVTLKVTRETAKTCATEIVMASHGINRELPLGQTVEITFTPEQPGELTYACAMDMYRGTIVAR